MKWAPTHGCALPLPKRPIRHLGLKHQGPKPSQLFITCQKDRQLAWILLVGGHEAVIEFALARAEGARHITEKRRAMALCRSAQRLQTQIAEQQAEIQLQKNPPPPAPLSWAERRALLIARDNERRLQTLQSGIAARVAATPKPSALTLQRQRLERTLNASPVMTHSIDSAPATTTHSRKAKGECGQRIGGKLDKLLSEIRHEAICESACCEAPIAVIEQPPEPSSVDPPAPASGAMAERAPDDSAAGGSGFLNQGTVWDVMSGQGSLLTDLRDFLGRLDEDPRLRASANLRTLSRVREHLERIPESAAMGDPVELRLQDVLVLMNQLMARMR